MKIIDLTHKFYKSYCEVHLKPTTCNGYRVNIENHIVPYIGAVDADKLTVDDVDELMEELKELASETIANYLFNSRMVDRVALKTKIKDDISKYLYSKTKRRPMILVILNIV